PIEATASSGNLADDVLGLEGKEEKGSRVVDWRDVELVCRGKRCGPVAANQMAKCMDISRRSGKGGRFGRLKIIGKVEWSEILVLFEMSSDTRDLFRREVRFLSEHQHWASVSIEFPI